MIQRNIAGGLHRRWVVDTVDPDPEPSPRRVELTIEHDDVHARPATTYIRMRREMEASAVRVDTKATLAIVMPELIRQAVALRITCVRRNLFGRGGIFIDRPTARQYQGRTLVGRTSIVEAMCTIRTVRIIGTRVTTRASTASIEAAIRAPWLIAAACVAVGVGNDRATTAAVIGTDGTVRILLAATTTVTCARPATRGGALG